jgi:hypothetical protein
LWGDGNAMQATALLNHAAERDILKEEATPFGVW